MKIMEHLVNYIVIGTKKYEYRIETVSEIGEKEGFYEIKGKSYFLKKVYITQEFKDLFSAQYFPDRASLEFMQENDWKDLNLNKECKWFVVYEWVKYSSENKKELIYV